MEPYSRNQLKDLKHYNVVRYEQQTENAVKYMYDAIISSAKHGLTNKSYDVRYVSYNHIMSDYEKHNSYNTVYVYDAKQAKIIVSKLKQIFYDSSIEFVQKAIMNEDKIYIKWD